MIPDSTSCSCGSGLRRLRCCALDLNSISPPDANRPLAEALAKTREAAQAGRNAEAAQQCRDILELSPGWIEALSLLAALLRTAQPRAAEALARRIVAIDRNNLAATLSLGLALLGRGALDEAEVHARNAVRIDPDNWQAHNLLGMTLTRANRMPTAEYHYRRVLELMRAQDPVVLANLAWNLKEQGRIAEARALYKTSLELAPNNVMTLLGAARLEEVDQQFAAAQALLDRVEPLAPENPNLALTRAVVLARLGDQPRALQILESLGSKSALDAVGLSEQGRILDRLGRYDEAWAAFDAGKQRLREAGAPTYLDAQASQLLGSLGGFFTARRLATLPKVERAAGPQPIFIIGFPRSGTTLLEQSISAHPQITAGDELPFVWEIANAAQRLLDSPLPYPAALAELWMGDKRNALDRLRDVYLRRAHDQGLASGESGWFTDKMPLNETHLGLIGLLFPQSPILHLVRHPLDVVVSVYSNHLTHGFHCAAALETAALHFARVSDLVAHYRREMSLRYLPVRYEELVSDQERVLREVFEFIGEKFDPRCLASHENARYARTASYAQVTEPLYQRSVYRHRHYLKGLAPVIPLLEPVIARAGYSAVAADALTAPSP